MAIQTRPYYVRRLPQGATGTNTINIYNPVQFAYDVHTNLDRILPWHTAVDTESGHPLTLDVRVDTEPEKHSAFEVKAHALEPKVLPVIEAKVEIPPPPRDPAMENLDAPVIAELMKEAARLGIPFCEKCTRAKLQQARSQAAPAPSRAKRQKAPPAPPPQDPAMHDVDATAMAQAMKEAARLGVPFCEKCTRAKLQQARSQAAPAPSRAKRQKAPPAPPQDPAMHDIDAAAMAQAMRDAARAGAPFCEKCERARLRAEREGRTP